MITLDKLLNAEYYLGPEFQRDSSLLRTLADTLILARQQDVYEPVKNELFLILTEFSNALLLMRHIEAHRGIYSFSAANQDTRELAAEEFRQKCTLADTVGEQLSSFIDYCADQINRKF